MMQAVPAGIRARWDALSDERKEARLAQWHALPEATRARIVATATRFERRLGPPTATGGDVTQLNDPPDAVFRTTPPANAEGIIRGLSPLEVTFNMCPSRDVDPGDELKYKYDYEGLGFFIRGGCRETYTYMAAFGDPREFLATVCVSDRQPEEDHTVCKTYTIVVAGGEACRTITSGQAFLPDGNALDAFSGSFNMGGGQTLVRVLNIAPDTPWTNIAGFNGFDCGGSAWGVDVNFWGTTDYAWEGPASSPFTAGGDYVGCSNDVDFESFGGSATVAWSTEVCDPGAF